ncbi:MAG: toll/interleukin-1 receptor domain-containing protein [Candidatus Hydrogenedentes bacterium]|nr:toll/interleukin-1 receptor domain-containing protein [Candidatus Hydrogenedentota bacterium]
MPDVFISFAQPDKDLANKLRALLTAVDLTWYFAPEDLPRSDGDWEENILKDGLKESRYFLPILTRESLHRSWVLFEAGAAAALKLPFLITHVHGIDEKEINFFPHGAKPFHFKLYEKPALKQLILKIGEGRFRSERDRQAFVANVNDVFARQPNVIEEVLCRARRRWVFIAGNHPRVRSKRVISDKFIRLLSAKLIEAGFNISACPQVEPVGKVALETAAKWVASGQRCPLTGCKIDYEIAGLYPLDRELRTGGIHAPDIINRWQDKLLEFRRSYLTDKDWLIVIGGNEGSEEEFDAVRALNAGGKQRIKVCFVTCFGGAAQELSRQFASNKNQLYFDACEGRTDGRRPETLVENILKIMT